VPYDKIILLIVEMNIGSRGGGGIDPGGFDASSSGPNKDSGNTRVIVGSIFGSSAGVFLLIYCCKFLGRRKATPANSIRVNNALQINALNTQNLPVFQSGKWSSRYYQYERWHDWHQLSLSFDPKRLKVSGNGSDHVGTFKMLGTYSIKKHRMNLTKTYQGGTGDRTENIGHKVTIQLIWNSAVGQFEGKWRVKTSNYHDENKFELKYENLQELSANTLFNKF
jgi:hypothetical protein